MKGKWMNDDYINKLLFCCVIYLLSWSSDHGAGTQMSMEVTFLLLINSVTKPLFEMRKLDEKWVREKNPGNNAA